MIKQRRSGITAYYYKFFLLICIEIMLAFSNMGYIMIPPVSITFMHIPVIVGAMLLGPWEGMALGGLFGMTSLWKATVTATAYADQIFSPFISGKPLESLILSVGTRMLFGFCAGLCFLLVRNKIKWKRTGIAVAAVVSMQLHSLLVRGAMQLLFPDAGVSVSGMFANLETVQEMLSMAVTAGIPLLVYQVGRSLPMQRLGELLSRQTMPKTRQWKVVLVCYLAAAVAVMDSLVRHSHMRLQNVMTTQNIPITEQLTKGLSQVELQLMVALIAFCGLMLTLMLFMECFVQDLAEQADKDRMTGLYNKTALEDRMKTAFAETKGAPGGVFIMMDIDYFKQINDTHGHPFGDRVLRETANILKGIFSQNDLIGRIGGDEFCVFHKEEETEEQLEQLGGRICNKIQELRIDGKDLTLTCSIGIVHCSQKENFGRLYEAADRELYSAKRSGRNGFSIEGIQHRGIESIEGIALASPNSP